MEKAFFLSLETPKYDIYSPMLLVYEVTVLYVARQRVKGKSVRKKTSKTREYETTWVPAGVRRSIPAITYSPR